MDEDADDNRGGNKKEDGDKDRCEDGHEKKIGMNIKMEIKVGARMAN